jgi:hypothetical protein
MLFTIKNKKYLSEDQMKTDTLMNAYFVIKHYPLKASDIILNNYLQNQYKTDLKNICVKLLLNLTFYKDEDKNLILLFKDPKDDLLARLVTYGNGTIPGSKILQIALEN